MKISKDLPKVYLSFSFNILDKNKDDPASLQSEIHSWLHSSKETSKRTSKLGSSKLDSASDFSDSDLDIQNTGKIRGIKQTILD